MNVIVGLALFVQTAKSLSNNEVLNFPDLWLVSQRVTLTMTQM